jgi:hypothetical protein
MVCAEALSTAKAMKYTTPGGCYETLVPLIGATIKTVPSAYVSSANQCQRTT